jgi:putative endonuclease
VHYVYIIQSVKTEEIYIGRTDKLKNRVNQHNANKNKSTKGKGPWRLIYTEMYRSKEDAMTRENRLKYYGKALGQLKRRITKSLL